MTTFESNPFKFTTSATLDNTKPTSATHAHALELHDALLERASPTSLAIVEMLVFVSLASQISLCYRTLDDVFALMYLVAFEPNEQADDTPHAVVDEFQHHLHRFCNAMLYRALMHDNCHVPNLTGAVACHVFERPYRSKSDSFGVVHLTDLQVVHHLSLVQSAHLIFWANQKNAQKEPITTAGVHEFLQSIQAE